MSAIFNSNSCGYYPGCYIGDVASCGQSFCSSSSDINYNQYKVTRTDLNICPSCGARMEDCKCIYCGNKLR